MGRKQTKAKGWPCRQFSLANPVGKHQGDLPRLLRRMADQLEQDGIDGADILDLTISQDVTARGPWWSATVYWSRR
ncbi:MAG: hypothetical protein U0Q15_11060 [Kineosporiaceae bacterium]